MFLSNLYAGGRLAARTLSSMASSVRRFFADNRAVSTVEYALIVVAVVGVVGGGAVILSGAFDELFESLEETISETTTEVEGLTEGGGGDATTTTTTTTGTAT